MCIRDRLEKPHSLSYHAEIFPILLPITLVREASIIADAWLWLKSTETSFSFVTFKIFFRLFVDAFDKELFSFFTEIFFLTLNTNSIKETFGVGTLIAMPSSFPFNEGIISPIAFDAPVDVGTIDWFADLALLRSLWELSNILWSLV